MRPVTAGLWRLHETFDGTYTVDDLMDALEILEVRDENAERIRQWQEAHRPQR